MLVTPDELPRWLGLILTANADAVTLDCVNGRRTFAPRTLLMRDVQIETAPGGRIEVRRGIVIPLQPVAAVRYATVYWPLELPIDWAPL